MAFPTTRTAIWWWQQISDNYFLDMDLPQSRNSLTVLGMVHTSRYQNWKTSAINPLCTSSFYGNQAHASRLRRELRRNLATQYDHTLRFSWIARFIDYGSQPTSSQPFSENWFFGRVSRDRYNRCTGISCPNYVATDSMDYRSNARGWIYRCWHVFRVERLPHNKPSDKGTLGHRHREF